MTILQLLPELKGGGVETGCIDLSRRLVQAGHRAIVISAGGPLAAELSKAGAEHITLPVHEKNLWTILRLIPKVARIIETEKVDIVHARSRMPAWIGYAAARRAGAVFITTCHGHYRRHLASAVMGWGKFVIAPSSSIAHHMAETFGVPHDRIRLIPRGVDLARFVWREPPEKPGGDWVVGMVARIRSLKGHEDMIRAAAKLVRSYPKLKLWIVGDAPTPQDATLRELKALAARLKLGQHVQFMGHRADVPALLSQMDVAVLPTRTSEGFGRAIVEAQAAGVPIVATQVAGIIDSVEEKRTGLLVPPGDPDALARAIQSVLESRSLRLRLSREARKKVESEFSLDQMAARTMAVYEEALRSKRILAIKWAALGDVILSIPSLRAIRQRFPSAQIALLSSPEAFAAVSRCPYVDEVIVADHLRSWNFRSLWKLGRRLKSHRFETVVDFQNNRKSHLLAFFSGAPERIGFDNGKYSFLLNRRVPHPRFAVPPVKHQFRLLSPLGIDGAAEALEMWTGPEEEEHVASLLAKEWIGPGQPLVGLSIGSSPRWETKRWPLESFVRLGDQLSARLGARVVLLGTREELPLAQAYAQKARAKPIVLVGQTHLLELAALLRRLHVLVTSDSAPLHVASAVGTPFVALFGPTSPDRHLPPADHHAVLTHPVSCAPCYSGRCRVKHHKCLRGVSVEEVFQAVEKLVVGREGWVVSKKIEKSVFPTTDDPRLTTYGPRPT